MFLRSVKRMLLTRNDWVENRTWNWKWNWKNANVIFWPAAWLAIVNTLMQRNWPVLCISIQRKRFVIHSLFSRETKAIIDFDWTGFRKQWNLLLHVLAICNSEFGVCLVFFTHSLYLISRANRFLCVCVFFFIIRSLTSWSDAKWSSDIR